MNKSTVFVAVHGIGDQVRNETIQAVAKRVYAHEGKVSALPLGAFPTPDLTPGVATANEPFFPGLTTQAFGDVGFVEVGWADVTRQLATAGYTLEESKRWARTLVQRLQKRDADKAIPEIDYILLQEVLNEMIDTVAVSDRLLSLARWINLGDFSLKRVLDQFLGDVQYFTDFETVRSKILAVFNEVMDAVHRDHPNADIVLVTHSEGTVVAFMALLLAAAGRDSSGKKAAPKPAWLDQVTALMTLGSPIDKHLIIWPGIWEDVEEPKYAPTKPIAWWNYYDHGDPVGFELDTARSWLHHHGFMGESPVFRFDPSQDLGFSRYPFAGKAHVDYWSDDKVFGHFLNSLAASSEAPPLKPPKTIALARLTSYLLPYTAAAVILCVAVYALIKGAVEAGLSTDVVLVEVVGYSSLLAGVTILARVPRLVRRWWRWLVGGLVFAASALVYHLTVVPHNVVSDPYILYEDGLILVGLGVSLVGILIGWWKPKMGMKPLVFAGSLAAVFLVSQAPDVMPSPDGQSSSRWPVLVGGAFFLYLWWLSALVFDLVFVWHRNIRHGATSRIMAIRRRALGLGINQTD